jgi:hypothetical protein
MDVNKATFDWGKGCFMRGVGTDTKACDVLWTSKNAKKDRMTIINGSGMLCDDEKVGFLILESSHDNRA